MNFISSCELENINGSEYLHLYLNQEASFLVKINGEDVEQNELYIKAPTMASKDVYDLRRCCATLSKFEDIHNEKISKELARLSDEERARLFSSFKEVEEKILEEIKPEDVARDHIRTILKASKALDIENTNFFTEFDRLASFLEQRLFRNLNGDLLKLNFSVFDKLLGSKQFFLEEIFVEYVGFFFSHFPLESLLLRKTK